MKDIDICRGCVFDLKKYVPGKSEGEVKEEFGLDRVIKLASNENPFGPSNKAIEAIKEQSQRASFYPDGSYRKLKEKIAGQLSISSDCIAFGSGSDEVIKLLGETFLNPNDEIITADITFPVYKHVATLMNANTVQVPLNSYKHDLEAMADKITDRTKMIFICNPNNPTGTIVTQTEVDEFMKKVPDNVLVVFDEAYVEYVESQECPNTLDMFKNDDNDNIILLRTFSKIHGLAGLRIGYGIAAPEIIELIEKVRQPFNVNALAHEAALASLEDHDHIKMSQAENIKEKKFLKEKLKEYGFTALDTQANFLFVKAPYCDMELFEDLMKRGIIMRPGTLLGMPGYFRLTIGKEEDNRFLCEKIEEILEEREIDKENLDAINE